MQIQMGLDAQNTIMVFENYKERDDFFAGASRSCPYGEISEAAEYVQTLAEMKKRVRHSGNGAWSVSVTNAEWTALAIYYLEESIAIGQKKNAAARTKAEMNDKYRDEPKNAVIFLQKNGIEERISSWLYKKRNLWGNNDVCGFPIKDFDGNDVSDEIYYIKKEYSGLAAGKKQDGFGFSVEIGKADNQSLIVFFDSALDLLACLAMNNTKWHEDHSAYRLVSLAGLKPSVINNYAEHYPNAGIIIAVGKGEAKDKFKNGILNSPIGSRCSVWTPPAATWRETLIDVFDMSLLGGQLSTLLKIAR